MTTQPIRVPDRLLSPGEAAAMLGLTPKSLDHRRRAGEFHFVRVGKLIRYRESTLLRWMEAHEGVMPSPRPRRRLRSV